MEQYIFLLGMPLLACLAMLVILAYLGIHVLKREIIFIDIAIAQIVAVGVIGVHILFGAHHDSMLAYATPFGLAILAAGFYAVVRRNVAQIPLEAVIGISYAFAAAGALFIVGVAPGGHVHVQHMLAGSILWATGKDVLSSAVVFLAVGLVFYIFRKPFGKISEDYDRAMRERMNVPWWDFLFYLLIGVVIVLAVRMAGILLVFAFLIIPATISALFSSRSGVRLVIAWSAGTVASIFGLLFAYRLDFSVGPSVALFLGIALVLSGLIKNLRPRVVAGIVGIVTVGLAAVLLNMPSSRLSQKSFEKAHYAEHVSSSHRHRHTHIHDSARHLDNAHESPEQRLEKANDIEELQLLFTQNDDPMFRKTVVFRALDLDRPTGLKLALRFLEENPPIFFRQSVTDRLGEILGEPIEFDVMKPYNSPENRKAVIKIRGLLAQ